MAFESEWRKNFILRGIWFGNLVVGVEKLNALRHNVCSMSLTYCKVTGRLLTINLNSFYGSNVDGIYNMGTVVQP